ncbi:pentapeptide repeat-containing protein [uncultured Parasphingorhabdus sp.]|uniref:pentapeptide repeat-containing protein n=1 Tax=uncultured Parasphingorhabdus sp. TaxID=2709694 RepID=UPI0030DB6075|tara:strand:+ start:45655 stop:47232 length:1578 start_codon:yes stop_codon:yes gene_type:complete
MKSGMLLRLVFTGMALGGASVASAEAAESQSEFGCQSAYGDIWAEDFTDAPHREINGASIQTPSDFLRMTGTREAGLKIINGGDFSGWDFSKILLANICFDNSKLTDSNFAGVQARGIGFIKSDLSGSNMRGAIMPAIFLRNANLSDVAAQNADFSGGHFDGGWFEGSVEGWNIDGADMSGFTFACGITVPDGCPVYQGGVKMSANGTDFSGATLHSFGLYDVELTGAILDQTILAPRQLSYLAQAEFRGAVVLRGSGSDVNITAEEARYLMAETARQKAVEAQPSFDCAKAVSKVEREVCGEYAGDLRVADRDIAILYKRAKSIDSGVIASQRAWLKQRNQCGVAESPSGCIRKSYSDRKGQLLGLLGENQWLARGEAALFIDDVLPLPAAVVESELFARISPILVGASMTEILIERADDGLYEIKGSSVGANAHLCSIYASHLYFDKESGWYIPVSEGRVIPIFRILDNRLEIFANGRPDYELYPEAGDFMSCGMRAGLDETIRVNASDELIDSYRKSLSEEM